MEVKLKPIPAFYCCYLLRSSVRHGSLYVGSSPHPSRRLAQHNGKAKGGAVRTSRPSLRPWEMACIVAGFPSNIAALQFEWAWQNSHLTRHISDTERISIPVTKIKTNRQTGKIRKAPGRPRTSLVDKLSNLHLLLRSRYFSKWPLELRFFSADVYKAWKTWCDRVDASLRSDINVTLDLPQPAEEEEEFSSAQRSAKRRKLDLIGKGGVDGVDPTYARYRDVFEKCQFLLDKDESHSCDVCKGDVDIDTELFSVCTSETCRSISHISCLSQHFLQGADPTQIVPKAGTCPSCKNDVQWSDLMRVLSLRLRGEKEVKKLMSKKKRTKAAIAAEILEEEEDEGSTEEEEEEEEMLDHDESNAPEDAGRIVIPDLDLGLGHDQDETQEHETHDEYDIDNLSVASHDSLDSPQKGRQSPASQVDPRSHRIEIVIEDSEEER